jgi:[ribosomal protein S5]-alanine N-acetyltransferase
MDFVGMIELRLNPPKADFGYVLRRSCWGLGYATEAVSAVVQWAIKQPTIFRVWATCHPDNKRSIRVLEKSGLHLEAKLINWEARPNLGEQAGDSLAYSLTRPSIP